MIKCNNVTCSYKDKKIVENVNFEVQNGKVCTLLGVNGSGKTTLINAISSNIKYEGNIFIDDNDIKKLKKTELSKKLGVMPQYLPNPKGINVKELVSLGRMPHNKYTGRISKDDEKIINKSLEKLKIEHLKNCDIDKLSGGEKQKVFFALLLAQETNNIVLDEPISNLDINNKEIVYDFIKILKEENKSILVVLHDIMDILRITDSICFVNDGKVMFFKNKEDFIESNILETFFKLKLIKVKNNQEDIYVPVYVK